MKLRTKFLSIGFASTLVLCTSLGVFGSRLLLRGFEDVEHRAALQDLARVRSEIDQSVRALERVVADWGLWDESVRYLTGAAPDFVPENIDAPTLENLGCQALIYFDAARAVVGSFAIDAEGRGLRSVPAAWIAELVHYDVLFEHRGAECRHGGLLLVGGELQLVAVSPIMASDRRGPIRGSLCALRALDARLRAEIERHSRAELQIRPLRDAERQSLRQSSLSERRAVVHFVDPQLLLATEILEDLFGLPVASLTARSPRPIRAQAASTLAWLQVLLLGILLLSVLGTMWALRRFVVRRLEDFAEQVREVGSRPESAPPIAIGGDDEIGMLATTVQRMQGVLAERNAELAHATQAAQAASRAKSEFLAHMSHEIRTPLNAILGFAELLESGDGRPAEQRNWAELVRTNGQQLHELIGDILDLTRIEAGHVDLELGVFDLHVLLEELHATYQRRAAAKGLLFGFELELGQSSWVRADRTRLRQIVVNLLGNAIKFTEEGGVELHARLSGTGHERRCALCVEDSGRGIAPDKLELIFEAFQQEDASTTRRFGGSGLGLAISRRLAVLMGGTLTVSSRPGEGSRFVLELPVGPEVDPGQVVPARETAVLDLTPLRGCRILLAEDGPDNALLVRMMLEKAAAEVTWVENGALAVEACLTARARGEPFALVLLDMQMPVLCGYDAAFELRRAGFEIPIVALTAHALQGDREKCLAAGCTEYLQKPIRRRLLLECCVQQLATGAGGAVSRDSRD